MKLITVSLKDSELKALSEIMKTVKIESLHRIVKIAINEYIEHFKQKKG